MSSQTLQHTSRSVDAVASLLAGLIDYAGLFPPASLPMAAALANYDAYLQSEWSWILGRFIVPVARLSEFETALAALPGIRDEDRLTRWRLSVLPGSDPAADVSELRKFAGRMEASFGVRRPVVESVEMKIANREDVYRLSESLPASLETYFEIPLQVANLSECVDAIARCDRRAKIRTGGETADKFPASESVIEFIRQCAASNVPFKATAGLHHPLRSEHRLTYQADSAFGMMHGFLNVFLAAAFLRAGVLKTALALELLEEQSTEAFRFDSDGIIWRGHRISREEIALSRRNFAISFGSCSFMEPIEDLRALHLL